MKSKVVTSYFLNISKEGTHQYLTEQEIRNLIKRVSSISLQKKNTNSRVLKIEDSFFYTIFSNDKGSLLFKDKKYISCIFAKDKHYNYPYKSDVDCNLVKIPFIDEDSDEEAITETTFILINPELSVMLWLSNRSVSSYTKLANYFNLLIDNNNIFDFNIELNPIIRQDQNERIELAKCFKYFEFNLVGNVNSIINNITSEEEQVNVTKELIEKPTTFNKISARLYVNEDEATNTEHLKKIYHHFKELFKFTKDNKLNSGAKAKAQLVMDDGTCVIDLIDDKFILKERIKLEGKYNDIKRIIRLLTDQMDKNNAYIKKNIRIL